MIAKAAARTLRMINIVIIVLVVRVIGRRSFKASGRVGYQLNIQQQWDYKALHHLLGHIIELANTTVSRTSIPLLHIIKYVAICQ